MIMCVWIYIYKYIYTRTHTYVYVYVWELYIYTNVSVVNAIFLFLVPFMYYFYRAKWELHPYIRISFCLHTVSSHVDVTGILGDNVTLEFTFSPNITVKSNSHYAIYRHISGHEKHKIEEYKSGKEEDIFDVYPKNNSVSWRIINLKVNDTGSYYVSLFHASVPPKESNKVKLSVQQVNRSSTGKLTICIFNNGTNCFMVNGMLYV